MKPTQYTIIHVLLGLVVLAAIGLNYALLAPHLRSGFSPAGWTIFAAGAAALVLAAFAPTLMRRRRGLPTPAPMSPADVRFMSVVAVAGCALAAFGAFSGMLWIMMLGILLSPLSLLLRKPRVQ